MNSFGTQVQKFPDKGLFTTKTSFYGFFGTLPVGAYARSSLAFKYTENLIITFHSRMVKGVFSTSDFSYDLTFLRL